jgi:hypothetical protein
MPMPPYQVFCSTHECKNTAEYKIAARWSDGVVAELKTYALSCDVHVGEWFRVAREKQKACRLTVGEIVEQPGIYHLRRGRRDQSLERLTELEQQQLMDTDR